MLVSQRGCRPTKVRLTVKFSIKNSSSSWKNSCAFIDVKIPSFARRKDFPRNESWRTFSLRFPRYVDSICTESWIARTHDRTNGGAVCPRAALAQAESIYPRNGLCVRAEERGMNIDEWWVARKLRPGEKKENGREWRDSDEARSFAKTIVEWCGQSAVTNFPRIIRTCTTARNNALPSRLSFFVRAVPPFNSDKFWRFLIPSQSEIRSTLHSLLHL